MNAGQLCGMELFIAEDMISTLDYLSRLAHGVDRVTGTTCMTRPASPRCATVQGCHRIRDRHTNPREAAHRR